MSNLDSTERGSPDSSSPSDASSSAVGMGRIFLSIGFGCLMYGLGLCILTGHDAAATTNPAAGSSMEANLDSVGPICMAVGGLILGAFIPLRERPQ